MNTVKQVQTNTMTLSARSDILMRRAINRFLLPLIIQNVAFSLSEFTDSIIVSNMLDEEALAIVNICMPIVLIFNTLAFLVGIGGASVYAELLGRQDKEAAERLSGRSIFLLISGSAVMTVLSLTVFPLITPILSGDPVMQAHIVLYIRYLSCAAFGYIMINGMTPFLTAMDHPKFSAALSIIANSINLVMDVVYVKVFGFGVEGTALATGTGYLIATMIMIVFLVRKRLWKVRAPRHDEWRDIREQALIGMSVALGQSGFAIKIAFISALVGSVAGLTGQVTFSLGIQSLSIASMIAAGIIESGVPLVSALVGERDYSGIRQLIRYTMIVLVIAMVICVGFFLMGTGVMEKIYSIEPQAPVEHGFRVIAAMHVVRFPLILIMYFYAALRQKSLSITISVFDSLLPVPIAWILSKIIGVDGIWWAFTIAPAMILLGLALVTASKNRKSQAECADARNGSDVKRAVRPTSGMFMLPYEAPHPMLDVTIQENGEGAADLSRQIIQFLSNNSCTKKASMNCGLLAEEMVTYILENSRKLNYLDVRVKVLEESVLMHFRDDGEPFDSLMLAEAGRGDIPAEGAVVTDLSGRSLSEQILESISDKCEYARYLGLNNVTVELRK